MRAKPCSFFHEVVQVFVYMRLEVLDSVCVDVQPQLPLSPLHPLNEGGLLKNDLIAKPAKANRTNKMDKANIIINSFMSSCFI